RAAEEYRHRRDSRNRERRQRDERPVRRAAGGRVDDSAGVNVVIAGQIIPHVGRREADGAAGTGVGRRGHQITGGNLHALQRSTVGPAAAIVHVHVLRVADAAGGHQREQGLVAGGVADGQTEGSAGGQPAV